MTEEVFHNKSAHRFELAMDGHTGYVEYRKYKGGLELRHTMVPEEIEGRGIAARLVSSALEYARSNGLKVNATCRYVKVFMEKYAAEYSDIEDKLLTGK